MRSMAEENRSMTMKMCLYPPEDGRGPRKSMAIDSHGRVGMGKMCACPAGLLVGSLFRWQLSQVWQYYCTSLYIPGQNSCFRRASYVFSVAACPISLWTCLMNADRSSFSWSSD